VKPAEQIAAWADKLHDISALGLRFADNPYDKERYRTVQGIAMAMLALATNESPERLESLRAPIFSRPTPFAVGDAAVIDEEGRILLIRRADNHKWAMPGGALEVGETPAEGIQREVFEETGVRCRAVALVGVFDSRLCGSVTRHHMYHINILCVPTDDSAMGEAPYAHEVLDVRWFAEGELPSDIDPGHVSRIPEAFRVWRGEGALPLMARPKGSVPAHRSWPYSVRTCGRRQSIEA
jgi:ADP-ribose pyrophosphatase YjhB (NUDIX family)